MERGKIKERFVWAGIAIAVLLWWSWLHRYATNTAAGRFYRTDRWRGTTTVVEKNGYIHQM